jgi:hypothetical protein
MVRLSSLLMFIFGGFDFLKMKAQSYLTYPLSLSIRFFILSSMQHCYSSLDIYYEIFHKEDFIQSLPTI